MYTYFSKKLNDTCTIKNPNNVSKLSLTHVSYSNFGLYFYTFCRLFNTAYFMTVLTFILFSSSPLLSWILLLEESMMVNSVFWFHASLSPEPPVILALEDISSSYRVCMGQDANLNVPTADLQVTKIR